MRFNLHNLDITLGLIRFTFSATEKPFVDRERGDTEVIDVICTLAD